MCSSRRAPAAAAGGTGTLAIASRAARSPPQVERMPDASGTPCSAMVAYFRARTFKDEIERTVTMAEARASRRPAAAAPPPTIGETGNTGARLGV